MSVGVMNKGGGVEVEGYVGMCSGGGGGGDGRKLSVQEKMVALAKDQKKVKVNPSCSSSSSSSIGKNSDVSSEKSGENSGDYSDEVQSSYKGGGGGGGPLDAMEALEKVLPIRRGISRFYNGKSKSFASLAMASSTSSSMKELAKPENAYVRRRRNLLASSLFVKSNGGGVSKRVTTSNRTSTALALAVTMSTAGNHHPTAPIPVSPLLRSSCLNPQLSSSAWRSYSLADLQTASSTCVASSATPVDVKPSQT